MGYTKKQSRQARQPVLVGDSQVTGTLTTGQSEIVTLSVVAEKVSFQASGSLAGTVEFSLDGVNFKNSTAIGASNAIVTYSTSLCKVLKVTASGGSGKLAILAK